MSLPRPLSHQQAKKGSKLHIEMYVCMQPANFKKQKQMEADIPLSTPCAACQSLTLNNFWTNKHFEQSNTAAEAGEVSDDIKMHQLQPLQLFT